MRMPSVQTRILAMGLLAFAASARHASAQQEPLHGLQPVDQRVADHGPLSTSLRWVQYGLREPYSFSELYQLPVGQQDYVRRNAGLWAVFPRSLYVSGPEGAVATVPAGTTYYIGGPSEVLPRIADQQAAYVPVGQVLSDRVDQQRLEAELVDQRIPASAIQPNMQMPADPRRSAPARTPVPSQVNDRLIDPDVSARAAWISSMNSLEFVRREDYRRSCLDRVMTSASIGEAPVERSRESTPHDEQSAARDQAASGSSESGSK